MAWAHRCVDRGIQRGENRQFKAVVEGLTGISGGPAEVARSRICHSIEDVLGAADDLGYPLVVRPSFTMGGVGSGLTTKMIFAGLPAPDCPPAPPPRC